MIRRDLPLGAAAPARWLLVSQPDHAWVSWELARAWGGPGVPPLVCPPDKPSHPLAAARAELLEAVRRHDDGWLGYSAVPLADAAGRPRNFTEMPPATAQEIWDASIDACRAVGPLAGWTVASHFHALQAPRDDDYPQWAAWLEGVDRRRAPWLDEWRAASPTHTLELAERCLLWLQAFDWMSLWLCCVCPVFEGDAPAAAMTLDDAATGWPPLRFAAGAPGEPVRVEPWPFATPELTLSVAAQSVAIPSTAVDDGGARPSELVWRLRG